MVMDRLKWTTETRMCEVIYTVYKKENMYCIIMEVEFLIPTAHKCD